MDALMVLNWWLWLVLIGLAFLPLVAKIFGSFFDKGYFFAKTIGLILLTLSLWMFSFFKIIPFYREIVYIWLGIAAIIVYFGFKGTDTVKNIMKNGNLGKILVYEEGLFLLCLIFFTFVRGQNPDINGTEKFMDLAFINNLMRTKFMPAIDMWFGGQIANYYYYGHYVFAFLTKLSGINTSITYNLSLATIFSFGFCLSFAIAANLMFILGKRKVFGIILAGLISASLLSMGGNLHTLIYAHLLPYAKSIGLYQGEVRPYFYADPRSYIGNYPPTNDKLITEYPAYSYILGDLHAQIIDVIFVLTFIALLLAFLSRARDQLKLNSGTEKPFYYIPLDNLLMIVTLPVLWMTNAWDYPIYITVMLIVFWAVNSIKYNFEDRAFLMTLINGAKILLISLLLLIPFLYRFINPTQGVHFTNIGHLLAPLYWFQMFVVWGYQFFFAILFMIYLFHTEPKYQLALASTKSKKKQATPPPAPQKLRDRFKQRFINLATADLFIFILCICAMGLVLASELVYQKDISGSDFYRANTVWKVTLQAFVMFDIVVGYIMVRVFTKKRSQMKQILLGGSFGLIWLIVMLYAFYGIGQPYNNLRQYKSIDGTAYMQTRYPDDYKAIQWLNKNIKDQPLVLEANGDSYSDYTRISVSTGLPTILGWYVHEWYWRGNNNAISERVTDIATIYESPDINATRNVISKYNVRYIVIGKLERDKFASLKEAKLLNLGTVVFESGTTKIIQMNRLM
jgi:YYY domain-containing protein